MQYIKSYAYKGKKKQQIQPGSKYSCRICYINIKVQFLLIYFLLYTFSNQLAIFFILLCLKKNNYIIKLSILYNSLLFKFNKFLIISRPITYYYIIIFLVKKSYIQYNINFSYILNAQFQVYKKRLKRKIILNVLKGLLQ